MYAITGMRLTHDEITAVVLDVLRRSELPVQLVGLSSKRLMQGRLRAIAGTWYIGYGETFDVSRLKALPSGSFYMEPPNRTHFAEGGTKLWSCR